MVHLAAVPPVGGATAPLLAIRGDPAAVRYIRGPPRYLSRLVPVPRVRAAPGPGLAVRRAVFGR